MNSPFLLLRGLPVSNSVGPLPLTLEAQIWNVAEQGPTTEIKYIAVPFCGQEGVALLRFKKRIDGSEEWDALNRRLTHLFPGVECHAIDRPIGSESTLDIHMGVWNAYLSSASEAQKMQLEKEAIHCQVSPDKTQIALFGDSFAIGHVEHMLAEIWCKVRHPDDRARCSLSSLINVATHDSTASADGASRVSSTSLKDTNSVETQTESDRKVTHNAKSQTKPSKKKGSGTQTSLPDDDTSADTMQATLQSGDPMDTNAGASLAPVVTPAGPVAVAPSDLGSGESASTVEQQAGAAAGSPHSASTPASKLLQSEEEEKSVLIPAFMYMYMKAVKCPVFDELEKLKVTVRTQPNGPHEVCVLFQGPSADDSDMALNRFMGAFRSYPPLGNDCVGILSRGKAGLNRLCELLQPFGPTVVWEVSAENSVRLTGDRVLIARIKDSLDDSGLFNASPMAAKAFSISSSDIDLGNVEMYDSDVDMKPDERGAVGGRSLQEGGSVSRSTGSAVISAETRSLTFGNTEILVYKANLTKVKVEAVVNAANGHLEHGGGVAGALLRECGREFQMRSDAVMEERKDSKSGHTTKPWADGSAVAVRASGNLLRNGVKWIINAVGPEWRKYSDGKKIIAAERLEDAVYNSFVEANSHNCSSVAISAISSGIFGVPMEICTKAYYDAAQRFASNVSFNHVCKRIHFVNFDDKTASRVDRDFVMYEETGGVTPSVEEVLQELGSKRNGRGSSLRDNNNLRGRSDHRSNTDRSRAVHGPSGASSGNVGTSFDRPSSDRGFSAVDSRAELNMQGMQTNSSRHSNEDAKPVITSQLLANQPAVGPTALIYPLGAVSSDMGQGSSVSSGGVAPMNYKGAVTNDQSRQQRSGGSSSPSAFSVDTKASGDPLQGSGPTSVIPALIAKCSSCFRQNNLCVLLPCHHFVCLECRPSFVTNVNGLRTCRVDNKWVIDIVLWSDLLKKPEYKEYRSNHSRESSAVSSSSLSPNAPAYSPPGFEAAGAVKGTSSSHGDLSVRNPLGASSVNRNDHQNAPDVSVPSKSSATASTQPREDDKEDDCSICIGKLTNPRQLPCKHRFCGVCIGNWEKTGKATCPNCFKPFGIVKGNQPPGGTMRVLFSRSSLPGFRRDGSIEIIYDIPSGVQGQEHPNPGHRFAGATRTAYLPDTHEGRKVLALLRKSFDAGLTFTVGDSVTTGATNVVTWNDIHHKTSHTGTFGYPDPTYLRRVTEELAARGIK